MREAGFYWVNTYKDEWSIGQWIPNYGWTVLGWHGDVDWTDKDLISIDERRLVRKEEE